jgi:hypothetical protein
MRMMIVSYSTQHTDYTRTSDTESGLLATILVIFISAHLRKYTDRYVGPVFGLGGRGRSTAGKLR